MRPYYHNELPQPHPKKPKSPRTRIPSPRLQCVPRFQYPQAQIPTTSFEDPFYQANYHEADPMIISPNAEPFCYVPVVYVPQPMVQSPNLVQIPPRTYEGGISYNIPPYKAHVQNYAYIEEYNRHDYPTREDCPLHRKLQRERVINKKINSFYINKHFEDTHESAIHVFDQNFLPKLTTHKKSLKSGIEEDDECNIDDVRHCSPVRETFTNDGAQNVINENVESYTLLSCKSNEGSSECTSTQTDNILEEKNIKSKTIDNQTQTDKTKIGLFACHQGNQKTGGKKKVENKIILDTTETEDSSDDFYKMAKSKQNQDEKNVVSEFKKKFVFFLLFYR